MIKGIIELVNGVTHDISMNLFLGNFSIFEDANLYFNLPREGVSPREKNFYYGGINHLKF